MKIPLAAPHNRKLTIQSGTNLVLGGLFSLWLTRLGLEILVGWN